MILTITPNPALDTTYRLETLLPGQSHRVASPVVRAGGKGLNVARVASSQCYSSHILSTAGGGAGELLRADLVRSKLNHTLIPISGETRRSLAFTETSGAATLFNETGVALEDAEESSLIKAAIALVPDAKVAVISGSFPPDSSPEFLTTLLETLRGIPTIVDTSGPLLVTAAKAGAGLLKPNLEELQAAVGIDDPYEAARRLIDLGAGSVLVSLGEAGLAFLQQGTPTINLAYLPEPFVGNPTGAGDALVAAIASIIVDHGSLHGAPIDLLLRRAVSWSAAAVLQPLAGEVSARHHGISKSVIISTMEHN